MDQASTTYALSVSTTGSGSVTKSPSQSSYAPGTEVTLTATPASGYVFSGWSGDAGGTLYVDGAGRTWSADSYYTGGVTRSKSFDVAGTTDDQLYLKYRNGSSSSSAPGAPFSYSIPAEAGTYTVRLHFLEPYYGAPGGVAGGAGKRVFHVDVEGQRVLSSYDIFAQDGAGKAVVKTFSGVSVSGGTLTPLFTSVTNNAIISAIELVKADASTTYALSVSTTGSAMQAGEQSGIAMRIYPNPGQIGHKVNSQIRGFRGKEAVTIFIHDVTGRIIKAKPVVTDHQGQAELDFTIKDYGLYIIRALSASGEVSQKLVIE